MNEKKRGTITLGRKTILSAATVVLLAACYFAWQYLKPEPNPRSVVMKYLDKKSGLIPWNSPESLRQVKEPWLELARLLQSANDYFSMYRHLGEYLRLAEQMLSSKEQEQQLNGIRIALAASRGAAASAEDGWVSARICEAYLVPNLALCDAKTPPTRDQLIATSVNAFQAEDVDGQIRVYKRIVSRETALHQADWARNQLAAVLSSVKRDKEALVLLKEIQDPTSGGKKSVANRIAKIEKKLAKQTNAAPASK